MSASFGILMLKGRGCCSAKFQPDPCYGEFHWSTNIGLFYCNLEDKQCHAEAEWNALMKPYMED